MRFVGNRKIVLENSNGDIYTYNLESTLSQIESEQLYKNDEILIDRKKSNGKIYSEVKKKLEEINPPANQTILQVRRDAKEYPYLEELANWAEGIRHFRFGNVHTYNKSSEEAGYSSEDFNKALESLTSSVKKNIIKDLKLLDYDIKLIDIRKEGNKNTIYIEEGNLIHPLRQSFLSQGMYRALALLIYIDYMIEKENVKLIIIDDLCEGLDFDRATALSKVIFNKMETKNVQFVSTSNDFFLMNTINIKHWSIIRRTGSEIKSFNYNNSKETFDNFKFTGLNNFQFFASNYLDNSL